MNDTFICYVYKFGINVDNFRCFLMRLTVNLYAFHFGYHCLWILGIIFLISIFGKIKENYRWFILNQVFWDAISTFDYSCENYSTHFLTGEMPDGKCPMYNFENADLNSKIKRYIRFYPKSALFLLVASRFLALFYPLFYDRITQKRKVIYIIFIFNIIIFLLHFLDAIPAIFINSKKGAEVNPILEKISTILEFGIFLFPFLLQILSMIAAPAVLWRILKQAKFQRKNNPNTFYSTLRIAAVIFLQTIVNGFVLFVDSLDKFEYILKIILKVKVLTSRFYIKDATMDFRLPLWLDGSYGLSDPVPVQMIGQFRIFVDSIIILAFMTGYREAAFKFFKFFWSFLNRKKNVIKPARNTSNLFVSLNH